MTIHDAFMLNLVGGIALAAILGLLIGEDFLERVVATVAMAFQVFAFSCVGWLIFVAIHFLGKYW